MQENNQQQRIAAPVMQVADQLAEIDHVLQMYNGFIGPVGHRLIGKFQHQTGQK